MKALSLMPWWAMPVALGMKTVEVRSWKTDYRGPLLICSSARKSEGCVSGHALCTVDLVSVEPFTRSLVYDAMMEQDDFQEEMTAWVLENVRLVKPFPVKGRQRLFDVDDSMICEMGAPNRGLVESAIIPLAYNMESDEAKMMWECTYKELGWA